VRPISVAALSLVVLIVALGTEASAIVFNDGQLHVIDATNSFPLEVVTVEDGPGGSITTVRLVDGGEAAINARGSSVVEVLGGRAVSFGGIMMEDNSVLSMSGGLVQGFTYASTATSEISGTAEISDNAVSGGVLNVNGGLIRGFIAVEGGMVNIFDGDSTGEWSVAEGGTLLVSGGVHNQVLSSGGTVEIADGDFQQVGGSGAAVGPGTVSILGGVIEAVSSASTVSVEIRGGSITELIVAFGGSMSIYGTGFNFAFGDIVPTTGTLVGTLADGAPIDVEFRRASTAPITLIASEPAPSISSAKTDFLIVDGDGDGRADPGDTARYTISVENDGTSDAETALLSDIPDPNSALVVGSVTTTQGVVVVGNGAGDTTVEVDIGALPQGGGAVEVTFDVVVDDPLPEGVLLIMNQGEVSGDNFNPVRTDDPDTLIFLDPTVTEIANTQLDMCERELDQCLMAPPFEDDDRDGEHDSTDACSGTVDGAKVDTAGCSLAQFCGMVGLDGKRDTIQCFFADWMNDTLLGPPWDCRVEKLGRHEYVCAPRN